MINANIRAYLLAISDQLSKAPCAYTFYLTINKKTRELVREVLGVDFGDGTRKGVYLCHNAAGKEFEGLRDWTKKARPFVVGEIIAWKSPEGTHWSSIGQPHVRHPAEIHVSVILKVDQDTDEVAKIRVIDIANWNHTRTLYTKDEE